MARKCGPMDGFHLDLFVPLIANQPITSLPAGALLFTRGEEADRFFILVEGRVKLYSASPAGNENILHMFGPGEFFGLPAMLGLRRYPVNGETTLPTRLIIMQRETVLQWLRDTPDQVPHFLALLSRRLVRMLDSLAAMKVLSPRARLCRFLLGLAEDHGGAPLKGPFRFRLPLPAHAIGGRVGLAPENVSRAFSKLKEDGVEVSRGRVVIHDMAQLRALAGQG